MKLNSIVLFILILLFGHLSSNAQNAVKMNQIQVIGSHNSYKKAIDPKLYHFLEKKDTSGLIGRIQYEHISIPEQLDLGLRNLEIDTYIDSQGGKFANPKGLEWVPGQSPYDPDNEMNKPGFKVLHIPDIDFRSSTLTFEKCLQELKTWSDKNKDHYPVFITLEPKDGSANDFGTEPEAYTSEYFDELDRDILRYLGKDKLITPDDVRGDYSTLNEAVLNLNWPALNESKGRFLFILDDSGRKRDLYLQGHPSLEGRVIFTNSEPGTPESAALIINDPLDKRIPELVKKGYIIRTRADADTQQARENDYSNFEKAKTSGAQIITTDYYLPSSFFKSDYKVSFDNNRYERINPVNGIDQTDR